MENEHEKKGQATEDSFMKRAWINLELCNLSISLSVKSSDDVYLDFAGFWLQQAVEMCLHDQLERAGADQIETHDIGELIRIGKDHHAGLILTDYIVANDDLLMSWEEHKDEPSGLRIEPEKIQQAYQEVKNPLLCGRSV